MSVRTSVTGQTGIHQTQAVQQLCSGTEGTANPRYPRSLVQRQRCRHIQYFIHLCLRRTGHPPSGVGRERFQIPSGAFGIHNAQRQRRFPGTGNSGNPYNLIQWNLHIYIFQIVYPCAVNFDPFWRTICVMHVCPPFFLSLSSSYWHGIL